MYLYRKWETYPQLQGLALIFLQVKTMRGLSRANEVVINIFSKPETVESQIIVLETSSEAFRALSGTIRYFNLKIEY